MTRRRHKRAAKGSSPRPPLFRAQQQCPTCGRYYLKQERCWFCNPPAPDHCHCGDLVLHPSPELCGGHAHLEHDLLERLSQLDYESIDETILLDTDRWPSDSDVLEYEDPALVGVAARGPDQAEPATYRQRRIDWRQAPEYKDFLRKYPDLARRARTGVDSIIGFFGLEPSEANAWSLEAAGYTRKAIADELGYREGGVDRLLDIVQAKLAAKLSRSKNAEAGAA